MKISRSILLLTALTPLALAHLATAQTLPTEAATSALAASNVGRQLDAQTVVLRVQPAVGARYRVKQFSRVQTQLPQTPGAPGGTGIVINKATLDMDITGRDSLGGTTMQLTFRAFFTENSGSLYGNGMTDEMKNALAQRNAQLSANFVGQSFSLKVAPNGKLWSLIIPESVAKNLFDMMSPGSLISLQTLASFAGRTNNKANDMAASATLPRDPLRLGDSWNYTAPTLTPGNFPLALSGQRTLKAIDNGVALVAETGTFAVPPQMPTGFLALTGTLTGASRIDIASGLPLETNLTTRFNGTLVGSGDVGLKDYPISSVIQDRLIIEPR